MELFSCPLLSSSRIPEKILLLFMKVLRIFSENRVELNINYFLVDDSLKSKKKIGKTLKSSRNVKKTFTLERITLWGSQYVTFSRCSDFVFQNILYTTHPTEYVKKVHMIYKPYSLHIFLYERAKIYHESRKPFFTTTQMFTWI